MGIRENALSTCFQDRKQTFYQSSAPVEVRLSLGYGLLFKSECNEQPLGDKG